MRDQQDPLPAWAVRALRYFAYADRWRWTPAQVDSIPLPIADDLMLVAAAVDEGRKRRQDRDQREAESRARAR